MICKLYINKAVQMNKTLLFQRKRYNNVFGRAKVFKSLTCSMIKFLGTPRNASIHPGNY